MSLTAIALAGYIIWATLLLLGIIAYRSIMVVKGEKAANEFNAQGNDVSRFGLRLTRAQANCIETFPLLGGSMILALVTQQEALTDPLALWLLGARLIQSIVHLLSTSVIAVQLRLVAFLAQLGISLYWLFLMLS